MLSKKDIKHVNLFIKEVYDKIESSMVPYPHYMVERDLFNPTIVEETTDAFSLNEASTIRQKEPDHIYVDRIKLTETQLLDEDLVERSIRLMVSQFYRNIDGFELIKIIQLSDSNYFLYRDDERYPYEIRLVMKLKKKN